MHGAPCLVPKPENRDTDKDLLKHACLLALLHALDRIVYDGPLLASLVHSGMLAAPKHIEDAAVEIEYLR